MAYKNACEILPPSLVKQIQQYIDGDIIYIPARGEKRIAWGCRNGTREMYTRRNNQIVQQYKTGIPVSDIADMFGLSEDSIRKILKK